MSVIKQTYIYCDGPDETCPQENEPWRADGSDATQPTWEQRRQMKRDGWKRIKGKDYCPDCAERLKPQREGERNG